MPTIHKNTHAFVIEQLVNGNWNKLTTVRVNLDGVTEPEAKERAQVRSLREAERMLQSWRTTLGSNDLRINQTTFV